MVLLFLQRKATINIPEIFNIPEYSGVLHEIGTIARKQFPGISQYFSEFLSIFTVVIAEKRIFQ